MTAEELRRLMSARRIKTGRELAARLGLHESTVSRWLLGRTRIGAGSAALIRSRI